MARLSFLADFLHWSSHHWSRHQVHMCLRGGYTSCDRVEGSNGHKTCERLPCLGVCFTTISYQVSCSVETLFDCHRCGAKSLKDRQGGRVGKSISPKSHFFLLFLFNDSLAILLAGVCNQRGAPPLAISTPSCYSSLACFPGRLNCTPAPRGGDNKTTSPPLLRIPIRHSQTTLSF